jgi:hypothetical protein
MKLYEYLKVNTCILILLLLKNIVRHPVRGMKFVIMDIALGIVHRFELIQTQLFEN